MQQISRYHWVKNNDADMTPPQAINNGRNIGGALLLRPEKTKIISARLQDDDIGVVGNGGFDATEHAGGSITDDASTGDLSIDTAFLEDGLQSCREGIRGTNAPTRCIAGANHNNVERTGMTGPDAEDEHHCYGKSRTIDITTPRFTPNRDMRGTTRHICFGSKANVRTSVL